MKAGTRSAASTESHVQTTAYIAQGNKASATAAHRVGCLVAFCRCRPCQKRPKRYGKGMVNRLRRYGRMVKKHLFWDRKQAKTLYFCVSCSPVTGSNPVHPAIRFSAKTVNSKRVHGFFFFQVWQGRRTPPDTTPRMGLAVYLGRVAVHLGGQSQVAERAELHERPRIRGQRGVGVQAAVGVDCRRQHGVDRSCRRAL